MAQLLLSTQQVTSNDSFFTPGLIINPLYPLIFNPQGNLSVQIIAQNVNCLFQSGAICGAHGTTAGIDSSTYLVDFTSLVPGTGSITAYIAAVSGVVGEGPYTIVGPPPGHPDYSALFNPYTAYNSLVYTLNIFVTTTAPDNQNTIELARTTLTAGQTVLSTLYTTSQPQAAIVVPPFNLGGDAFGPYNSNYLANIWAVPLIISGLIPNQVIQYNGTNWGNANLPTTLPPNGPAGGDLGGTYPNPVVEKSSASPFTANRIVVNGSISTTGPSGNMLLSGGVNAATLILAQGDLESNRPYVVSNPLNEAFQNSATLVNSFQVSPSQGIFYKPAFNSDTNTPFTLIEQWGFTKFGSGQTSGTRHVVFQQPFTMQVFDVQVTFVDDPPYSSAGGIVYSNPGGITTSGFYVYIPNDPVGPINSVVGFNWHAWGY